MSGDALPSFEGDDDDADLASILGIAPAPSSPTGPVPTLPGDLSAFLAGGMPGALPGAPKPEKPRYQCAGSRRTDYYTGKKRCNYKAVRRWEGPCPQCGEWFGCLSLRRGRGDTQRVTLGADTMAKAKPLIYVPTGIVEFDKVLNGGVVMEKTLLIGAPRGAGKPLACDTPVPTPTGWSTQGDLKAGDEVIGADGKIARVLGNTGPMYGKKCYRLTFSDGTSIVADGDHPWSTLTHAERCAIRDRDPENRRAYNARRPKRGTGKKPYLAAMNTARGLVYPHLPPPTPQIRTTEEIASTLRTSSKKPEMNHSIDQMRPSDLASANLQVPPYTLGAWLGDGHSAGARITSADAEVIRRIEADGFTVSPNKDPLNYGVLGLGRQLREAGVLGNKHIPLVYLRASVAQRIELLRGLMDTDGYANKSGGCVFTSSNKRLFDGVVELLRSLGIVARVRSAMKTCTNSKTRAKTLSYSVQFSASFSVFCLERKKSRQKLDVHRRYSRRYIVNVEPVESVPVCCIKTDRDDGLYVVGEQWIVTHNTTLLLQACNGFAQNGRKAYFASGEMTQDAVIDYAKRLGITNDNIGLYGNPEGVDVERLFDDVLDMGARLVCVDSMQVTTVSDVKGDIGQPTMMDAATNMITSFAQKKKRSFIVIGHFSKNHDYGGSEKMQHLVDGLLRMDIKYAMGSDGQPKDVMIREISIDGKLRQGPADVSALVELTHDGIKTPSLDAIRALSRFA